MTEQFSKKAEAWSARFSEPVSDLVKRYTASVFFDKRLAMFDIEGSLAHAEMLAAQGIISPQDRAQIERGMAQIRSEIEAGSFEWLLDLEDVHLNIEKRLTELVGDAGKRLHTGRSRNDQVATDIRLYVRAAIDDVVALLGNLRSALTDLAERHFDTIMPGFTHLQVAQPITFGHHMLAYVEMFARDRGRFADARARMNESPLGAAALAGTSFPIDRDRTARSLGFDRPMANSLDAVSDRDFALEFLSAAGICAVHLSRLAEELVIWSTAQFRFVRLSDRFSTGSSIMPQKRNPDAAELVRAKTGRILGASVALLTVMKGLPLAYSKDMQEDKEQVFDAADSLFLSLAAATGMMEDLRPDPERMRAAAGAGFATATDLADWLVRARGMPFREAHHVTGALVARAEAQEVDLPQLSLKEMQEVHPGIDEEVFGILGVDNSVKSRTSLGGTSPVRVREQIARWKDLLA